MYLSIEEIRTALGMMDLSEFDGTQERDERDALLQRIFDTLREAGPFNGDNYKRGRYPEARRASPSGGTG